jgi:hypothetical protein
LKSDRIIRPGVKAPPARRLVHYFDGDMTPPEVFAEPFSEGQIAELMVKGLPKPEGPPLIEVEGDLSGRIQANVWQAGKFSLDKGRSINVPEMAPPIEISGPWTISFPAGAGAPADLTFDKLDSLHRNADTAIRHFAGTVSYRNTFQVPPEASSENKRLWLDLGRVAVIAEVHVNGQKVGALWKPPYRVELTGVVRQGLNDLEVRVTTLLVNRLIGDESLPVENQYHERTRAIVQMPEWFAEGRPKPPGGRTTFATWRFYGKDDPLVESGLLGPVSILTSVSAVFE